MLVIPCGSPATAGQEAPTDKEDNSSPHRPLKSRWQQKGQQALLFRVMEVPGCLGPFLLRRRQQLLKHLVLHVAHTGSEVLTELNTYYWLLRRAILYCLPKTSLRTRSCLDLTSGKSYAPNDTFQTIHWLLRQLPFALLKNSIIVLVDHPERLLLFYPHPF